MLEEIIRLITAFKDASEKGLVQMKDSQFYSGYHTGIEVVTTHLLAFIQNYKEEI